MPVKAKTRLSILAAVMVYLFPMSLAAWEVSPLVITDEEGATVYIDFLIQETEWIYNSPNCNSGQWGVPFEGIFEDGTAVWGEDLNHYVNGPQLTGVCASQDPTCDGETTVSLRIDFEDDQIQESTEEASIRFQYCPLEPQSSGGSGLEACQQATVTLTIEDNDLPDLDAGRVTVVPRSVYAGGELSIESRVENSGNAASGESVVYYLLSNDSTIDNTDFQLAQNVLPVLEPGELIIDRATVAAPFEPGSYWIGTCVAELPVEESYSNNCSRSTSITVNEVEKECETGELACGGTKLGSISSLDCESSPLGEGHFARMFEVSGQPGATVWFEASWSFDGYLLLEDPNELVVAENDNFTSSGNSRIEYTFDQAGVFNLWLSSYSPGDSGEFEVLMDCNASLGPDLLSHVPSGSLELQPSERVSISSELANVGDTAADSSTLRWYLSSDSEITGSDTQLTSQSVGALAADATRIEISEIEAPATPGTYWIGNCVDSVSGEAATTNNCSNAVQLQVPAPPSCNISTLSCGGSATDSLSSSDCSGSPRGSGYYSKAYVISAKEGETLSITSDWVGVDGYLYLTDSINTTFKENDDNTDSRENQSLIEFTPPRSGNYRVWATTYDRNQPGEFNLSIECRKANAPDLVATASLLGSSAVKVGDTVSISYTILNQGNAPAAATDVLMCLSHDPVISLRDKLLDKDEIGSLKAGESVTVEMDVTVPAEPGDYWVGPCAKKVFGEAITGNNCSSLAAQSAVQREPGQTSPALNNSGDGGLLLNVSSGSACISQPIACGQSQQGSLQSTDCDTGPRGTGYVSDAYTFQGNPGDTITLNANWQGVDGFLYLENPAGEILDKNDDFSGPGSSRIELVLDQSGNYTVWPTAFGQEGSGSYELSLACNMPQSPDLEVDSPQLSASSLRPGQSLQIRTRARNKRGFTVESSKLDFILAANQELAEGDRILKSNDVPTLQSGESSDEEAMVDIVAPPGQYYIGSCVNADADETDTNNNCKVSGPITVEQTNNPIPINTGLNDAWYNPATDGQGFFINVFPDKNLMFLSWFTFDTERPPSSVPFELGDPGHRWLTAQGTYDNGVGDLLVTLTEGGVFDAPEPAASQPAPYGNMTVSFSDCNNGLIEYDLYDVGLKGSIPIIRVADENVAVCEQQLGGLGSGSATPPSAGDSSFVYNASLNDAWYDPSTNGQGFFFNVYPGLEYVFVSWFTYDVERPPSNTPFNLGEPGHRWLTAQGNFVGDTANLVISNTSGGVFNKGGLPPGSRVEDGSLVATFENCNSGRVNYSIDSIGRQGSIPIQRISLDTVPACDQQSKGGSGGGTGEVSPEKDTLENLCGGSVDWLFDWPEVEGASFYLFELYRNDSLAGSPRATGTPSESRFEYSGKEPLITVEHLDNWKWRYRPVMSFGKKSRVRWSEFYTFSVRQPDSPCVTQAQ